MRKIIRGKVYVVRDNIDTDQIIPAQYLNLLPNVPEEYEKLGSHALAGLPDSSYPERFVKQGAMDADYAIIIGGRNFGCGSSREHAPVALGAANCEAVVAEGFARIFFRNCVATGEIYPIESTQRLCDTLQTGDEVVLDLDKNELLAVKTGQRYALKPLGDARAVIDAGGLFAYAKKTGMMAAR
jgi:3-isopropylmalate/(R)-2-methylmalate dehydratase small subunit